MRNEETGEEHKLECGIVIGTDGSASSIRQEFLKLPRFNFSQQYLDYGYKELTIPAGPNGEHQIETHALHIWPRGNYMLDRVADISMVLSPVSSFCRSKANTASRNSTPKPKSTNSSPNFPDALRLMPQFTENYFVNPTGAMVTIKCSPWHHGKARCCWAMPRMPSFPFLTRPELRL